MGHEHRLFCYITANWRGTPLTTYETIVDRIVDRIGNTQTAAGLRVPAELGAGEYPTGVKVTAPQMDAWMPSRWSPMRFMGPGITNSSLDEVDDSISFTVLSNRSGLVRRSYERSGCLVLSGCSWGTQD